MHFDNVYQKPIGPLLPYLAAVEGAPEEGDLPLGKAAAGSEDAASAELLGVDAQAGEVIADGALVAGSEATSGLGAVLAGLVATDVIPVVSFFIT